MTAAQYLVDTSAITRMLRDSQLRERWREPVAAGLVAVCPIVELELLFSARSPADRARLVDLLHEAYGWIPMPTQVFDRASAVQEQLTVRGAHRSAGPVDLMVAATAELHGVVLLHYDRDFEQIAQTTGQAVQWVAAPGSVS